MKLWVIFLQSMCVTDRNTDRWTDRQTCDKRQMP